MTEPVTHDDFAWMPVKWSEPQWLYDTNGSLDWDVLPVDNSRYASENEVMFDKNGVAIGLALPLINPNKNATSLVGDVPKIQLESYSARGQWDTCYRIHLRNNKMWSADADRQGEYTLSQLRVLQLKIRGVLRSAFSLLRHLENWCVSVKDGKMSYSAQVIGDDWSLAYFNMQRCGAGYKVRVEVRVGEWDEETPNSNGSEFVLSFYLPITWLWEWGGDDPQTGDVVCYFNVDEPTPANEMRVSVELEREFRARALWLKGYTLEAVLGVFSSFAFTKEIDTFVKDNAHHFSLA